MRVLPKSIVVPGHPDFVLLNQLKQEIELRLGGHSNFVATFSERILEAIEFLIDPIRTGRTKITDLDNVEKTFIGLKVEHFVRDLLDAPKGIRDLILLGHDVDIKNTVANTWMIPQETYKVSGPCLLIAADETSRRCWLGLIIARRKYLGKRNHDKKRGVLKFGKANILWIIEGAPWPRDRWEKIDMKRFRELRAVKPGSQRAAEFFRENLRTPIHRTVINSLMYDQKDFMKRLRASRGAKDILRKEEVALVSGAYFNPLLKMLGLPPIARDEHIAVDGRTKKDRLILIAEGHIDAPARKRKTFTTSRNRR